MVKIITCCRTTSRLPSPLLLPPFNKQSLLRLPPLSPFFWLLLPPPPLPSYLSFSVVLFFPCSQPPDFALFSLCAPVLFLLFWVSSLIWVGVAVSPHERFCGGKGFLSW